MRLDGCSHMRPPCPITASRWQCAQRTKIETMVLRGEISRDSAHSFLTKYDIPITPASATEIYNQQHREQRRLL